MYYVTCFIYCQESQETLQTGDQVTIGALTFLFQTAAATSVGRRCIGGGMLAFKRSSGADDNDVTDADNTTSTSPVLNAPLPGPVVDPTSPPPGSLADQVFGAAAFAMTTVPVTPPKFNNTHLHLGSKSEGDESAEAVDVPDTPAEPFKLVPRARSRPDAAYDYNAEHEHAYLAHLVINMASNQFTFKLMPAYGLFMMFHAQREQDMTALMQLQCMVASLLEMATHHAVREHNVNKLALLLANTSELLAALRTDETLVSTSGSAQVTITGCVTTAFQAILADTKNKIRPALPAVLYEDAALADTEWASQIQSKRGAQVQSMDDMCATLTELHDLLSQCLLGPSVIRAMFESLYYFIGAAVFNMFMSSKDRQMYRWDRGLLIRFNLSNLVEWSKERGYDFHERHLERIMQAAVLLQINKDSLAHLDTVCESCASLNSLQVEKILRGYQPAEGDKRVPANMIDCIVGRAMTKADVADKEDESVSNTVQLLRAEDHLLPFRLEPPFHVDEGLYDDALIQDAKTYLSLIDLASTSCKIPKVLDERSQKTKRSSKKTKKLQGPQEATFFSKWFAQ